MTDLNGYLEDMMDKKEVCSVRFRAGNGGITVVRSRIIDLFSREGLEYIGLQDGLEIGLDTIISVNERIFKNFS